MNEEPTILSVDKIKEIEDYGGAVAWLNPPEVKVPKCHWCGSLLFRSDKA